MIPPMAGDRIKSKSLKDDFILLLFVLIIASYYAIKKAKSHFKSQDPKEAQNKLMSAYSLSEKQSKAILDMRLQRLTGLEVEKVEPVKNELSDFIIAKIIKAENVLDHEKTLTSYALQTLSDRFGNDLIIHGPNDVSVRGGVLSMCYQDIHPHDVSQILDSHGVCVRAGHHCAKPLMKLLDVNATVRASLYLYNDESDVDALADALEATGQFFSP